MKSFISLCLLIVFASCASKINIQKRRYNKGFHWAICHKQNTTSRSQIAKDKQLVIHRMNKVDETKSRELIIQNTETKANTSTIVQPVSEKKAFTASALKKKNLEIRSHELKTKEHHFYFKRQLHPDKEKNVPGTALFVLVCVLAGFFAIAGIGYVILFLSTSANVYLLFALASGLLSALFFVIMNSMNQVE